MAEGAANPDRAVLVTQQRIGDDTKALGSRAPRLWQYLQTHSASFSRWRSSDLQRPASLRDVRNRAVQLRTVQSGDRGA